MKPGDVIEKMQADIDWYDKNIHCQDINQLAKVADHLAINNYYLAESVAKTYDLSNKAELAFKDSVNASQAKSDLPVSKSKILAEKEFKTLREDWKEADGTYKYINMKYQAVETIIDQLRQRISYLKDEKRQTRSQVQP